MKSFRALIVCFTSLTVFMIVICTFIEDSVSPSMFFQNEDTISFDTNLLNHTANNLTLDDILEKWRNLFHRLIVQNHNGSITENAKYVEALLLDSYCTLNPLMDTNSSWFSALSSSTYKHSFHDLIGLRREIMMISSLLISDDDALHQFVYQNILGIFVKLSAYYRTQRAKEEHPWFHLHVRYGL